IVEKEGKEQADKVQDEAIASGKILVKDAIADIFLQQILTRPAEFDVVVTMNLNGDYISDALAAQVGGIGIAPGANINYVTGDRKSTRLNSSHVSISYAVFCLK